jgi:tRNA G37 N-methylase TrmD
VSRNVKDTSQRLLFICGSNSDFETEEKSAYVHRMQRTTIGSYIFKEGEMTAA